MFTRLSIFNKGILIVSIPLLVQAVFIGGLVKSASDNARAQRWAMHTKQVIAKVEETYRRFLESNAVVRDLIMLEHRPPPDQFALDKALMSATVDELGTLVADNKAQQSRVAELAQDARDFSDLLARMERLARTGGRAPAASYLEEAARSLADLRSNVDAILAEELRLDRERMARNARANTLHFSVLVGGGAATIVLTLALAILFLNRVVRRLDVLRNNARRFGEGKALSAPLAGRDELALVDQAFHEMAVSLDEQKQENELFVYSVSHDLRSPLINLQGFSQELRRSARDLEDVLEKSAVPQSVREQCRKLIKQNFAESVHYIQVAVERLARIIESLLRLSRAGRVQCQWQKLDLMAVVGRVVDALRDTIREKNARIVVNPLPEACGDPTAVEQIFANLIGNAVKYLEADRAGRIEFGCLESPPEASNDFRVYYVKDNGMGIPDAYHPRVFTAFNRLHADASSGEGIGLALVRRMVDRHGGSIWMQSAAGAGTTFFAKLPSHLPNRAAADGTPSAIAVRN
jgi:signal transduction histidine kinase